jgi:glutamate-ammonia-ligase adenylyltransferase
MIEAMQSLVEREMARVHGEVPGGAAVVVAMGKLGGLEMTAASDLDLIVIYDFAADAQQSDGGRPLPPTQYFTRLTQRLISAFTAQTAEGQLYEVDMRLRPSGQKGPVATQLSSFIHYQAEEAWTWEHLALTRARVVSGPPKLKLVVEDAIAEILRRPRERGKIAADVRSMRARIEREKGSREIWDLKQVRGGLVDLEFIAQYLQLVHAAARPEVLSQNTLIALGKLEGAGVLAPAVADSLRGAGRLLNNLTQILRLCQDGPFIPKTAPEGLKLLLARAGEAPDFASLEAELLARQGEVAALFERLLS